MDELPQHHPMMPVWVPICAQRYLAHTEAGYSIRNLARTAGVHASTVLRQVRRVETRRDDPLVDAALSALALAHFKPAADQICRAGEHKKDAAPMTNQIACTELPSDELPNAATLRREARRILRRLCETGAVLAVADQMEKAVVVRDGGDDGDGARTAVVDRAIARAMALQDWISCPKPGRISRYRITASGRTALSQMLAEAENQARTDQEMGFSEAQAAFAGPRGERDEQSIADSVTRRVRRLRYTAAESPLTALARRKDRDGKPFLGAELVQAGERLREDFELAQMGPRVTQNWDRFLTSGTRGGGAASGAGQDGSSAARERLAQAMHDLGPGLSDVALRCCCYLEGLEIAEKRMGWSARSGKIVLRIALQRLRQHYETLSEPDRMIG